MTPYQFLYREEASLKYSFQSNFVLLLQECGLVFGSWTHNKNEIDLQFEENTTGIDLEMFYGPYRVRIVFLPIAGVLLWPITCKQRLN